MKKKKLYFFQISLSNCFKLLFSFIRKVNIFENVWVDLIYNYFRYFNTLIFGLSYKTNLENLVWYITSVFILLTVPLLQISYIQNCALLFLTSCRIWILNYPQISAWILTTLVESSIFINIRNILSEKILFFTKKILCETECPKILTKYF